MNAWPYGPAARRRYPVCVTFHVTQETADRLNAAVAEQHLNRSIVLRRIVEDYLNGR